MEHLAPRLQRPDQNQEKPPPDLVIHVGVSAGDSAIRLEQRARKFGYNSLDAAGILAPSTRSEDVEVEGAKRGFVGEEWEAAPEELRTVLDADKVIRWVKSQGVAFISPSEDAGEFSALDCSCCAENWVQLTTRVDRIVPLRILVLRVDGHRPTPQSGQPDPCTIHPRPSVSASLLSLSSCPFASSFGISLLQDESVTRVLQSGVASLLITQSLTSKASH